MLNALTAGKINYEQLIQVLTAYERSPRWTNVFALSVVVLIHIINNCLEEQSKCVINCCMQCSIQNILQCCSCNANSVVEIDDGTCKLSTSIAHS